MRSISSSDERSMLANGTDSLKSSSEKSYVMLPISDVKRLTKQREVNARRS
jgi:hypothetical protein